MPRSHAETIRAGPLCYSDSPKSSSLKRFGPAAGELVAPSGVLAGLQDRQLALVLQAIHAEINHNWTLPRLAGLAAMSRSAFARRFQETIGMPPMAYILRWRMAVAKSALINERLTLDEVAERTGYGSAGALSHAFLRAVGCTPSAFRQQREEPAQETGRY